MIHHPIRRLLLIVLAGVAPFFSLQAQEVDKARLNVADYFVRLPQEGFEGTPPVLLENMRYGGNVIDKKNGYLRFQGDGGQPPFEVALFRYRDDRPLLAVCRGELEGAASQYLKFYVPGPSGRMQDAPRSTFPVKDGAGRQFILPRNGRTVIVLDKSSKRERRFTWDGARFVEEN